MKKQIATLALVAAVLLMSIPTAATAAPAEEVEVLDEILIADDSTVSSDEVLIADETAEVVVDPVAPDEVVTNEAVTEEPVTGEAVTGEIMAEDAVTDGAVAEDSAVGITDDTLAQEKAESAADSITEEILTIGASDPVAETTGGRAETVDFSLVANDAAAGESVVVMVNISENSYFTNATMYLHYDPAVVSYVPDSAMGGAISPSTSMVMANDFPEKGYVKIAYVTIAGIQDGGELLTAEFTALSDEPAAFSLSFDECMGVDENGNEFSVNYSLEGEQSADVVTTTTAAPDAPTNNNTVMIVLVVILAVIVAALVVIGILLSKKKKDA